MEGNQKKSNFSFTRLSGGSEERKKNIIPIRNVVVVEEKEEGSSSSEEINFTQKNPHIMIEKMSN